MTTVDFQPLIQADREEAAAAAAWLSKNPEVRAIETVARVIRHLSRRIEQTLLLPAATPRDVVDLCTESRERRFLGVCVSPIHLPLAVRELGGSHTRVVTVVGFPSGAHPTDVKAREAAWAVDHGADEIDMVLPIGLLRAGLDPAVRHDIEAVVTASAGRIVKVILETAFLEEEEKVRAVRLAREAGAAFVKTSTGFGPGGATERDVALLRREAGTGMGVKAAGGIRNTIQALRMIASGADRIGTSAGVAIVTAPLGQSKKL
jgi:deoxyribose-phosphate aldolase